MFIPNQLPAPFFLGPDTLALATSTTGPAVAGQIIANGYVLEAQVIISAMRVAFSGAPTGTCQLGIYDATGNNQYPNKLLGSTATFAAANGTNTKNLTSPLLLNPGRYWLAFLDTVADTVYGTGGLTSAFYAAVESNATGLTSLPNTFGNASAFNVAMAFSALIQNAWS